jgi:hypothetical protein
MPTSLTELDLGAMLQATYAEGIRRALTEPSPFESIQAANQTRRSRSRSREMSGMAIQFMIQEVKREINMTEMYWIEMGGI